MRHFSPQKEDGEKQNIQQVHTGGWIPGRMLDGEEQAKSGNSSSQVQRRIKKYNLTQPGGQGSFLPEPVLSLGLRSQESGRD